MQESSGEGNQCCAGTTGPRCDKLEASTSSLVVTISVHTEDRNRHHRSGCGRSRHGLQDGPT